MMKVTRFIFQSATILAFLTATALFFNYLSARSFSNPFLVRTATIENNA